MSKKNKKKDEDRLRLALSPEEISSENAHLIDAINTGTPLACVLISAAALENALMSLPRNYFVDCDESKDLFDIGGESDSFSSCYRLAFCLGLIEEEDRDNLKSIAKIRNLFAHRHTAIDFDNEKVAKECEKLKSKVIDATGFGNYQGRPRFSFVAINVYSRLLLTALSTTHRDPCKPYAIGQRVVAK